MKHIVLLTGLYLTLLNQATAQTQTQARKSSPINEAVAIRNPGVDDLTIPNQVRKPATETSPTNDSTSAWGDTSAPGGSRQENSSATDGRREPATERAPSGAKLIQQTSMPLEARAIPSGGNSGGSASSSGLPPLNSIYRVGVGDVLDIRLLDLPSRESTLFTVLKGGLIDYPLIADPLRVEGLRTSEIALALARQITVIQAPRVVVTVRDYASHIVTVTGLVESPGSKLLRREAMPLYAVLAEALPRPEASIATITRANGKVDSISLSDSGNMSSLVFSGDTIKLSSKPTAKRFLYVGGDVTSPGEKEYREGITLTQLLLASGGTLRTANTVAVARLNSNGFLTNTQYDLSKIQEGLIQDPLLEPGDRIEVMRRPQ